LTAPLVTVFERPPRARSGRCRHVRGGHRRVPRWSPTRTGGWVSPVRRLS